MPSFQDFCQRMCDCTDMNKRAVENLIRCGAFDSLGARRSQLVAVYERVLDGIASCRRKNVEGQMDLFGMSAVLWVALCPAFPCRISRSLPPWSG